MVTEGPTEPLDGEVNEQFNDEFNQVAVRTITDALYCVEYVLRHPDKKWMYAMRVTDVTDGELQWNDVVFRVENVEAIESPTVSQAAQNEIGDSHRDENNTLVHHSGDLDDVDISDAWKAWILD